MEPLNVFRFVILGIVGTAFVIYITCSIVRCVCGYAKKKKAAKQAQAQAPEEDTEEARKTAIKKAADDRLAEFQHRREIEAAKQTQAQAQPQAPEKDTEEAPKSAIKKAADRLAESQHRRDLEAARKEGWNQAQDDMKQERQRRTDRKAAGNKAVEEIIVASARYKAQSLAVRKAEQKLQRLKAEGKSEWKAEQELQHLKNERLLTNSEAVATGVRKQSAARVRGKPWDKEANPELSKLLYPDTDSEGEE